MLNLFFPKLCNGCNSKLLQSEFILCTNCRHQLPIACHHRNNDQAMRNIFYGRIPVKEATALLYFSKMGIVQQLLHNLKYRRQEEISIFLGQWLGAELAETEQFQSVDLVIPVPLHKSKKRNRGYNQVTGFGKEIANAIKVPYRDDILLKVRRGKSQAFSKRLRRFDREQPFELVDNSSIKDCHILLVDDIITTGSTIEQCASILLEEESVSLSVATMAIAL